MSSPVQFVCRRGYVFAGLVACLTLLCASAWSANTRTEGDGQACCGPISPAAQDLARFLDDSGVDHLWLAHQHVNWESGEPDRPPDYAGSGRATHCSAYAAAMGKRLGIYMLRPPAHSAALLASAQTLWFSSAEGTRRGWEELAGAQAAQSRANAGALVVISYASPNPSRPGHIAIVRPSLKTKQQLQDEGPQIAQAGALNSTNDTALRGFARHPGAWPDGVRYFGHVVPGR